MEEMLLHTDNFEAAEAEIESIGGKVTMFLGDELMVANIPTSYVSKKESFASSSAHIAQSASSEALSFVQAYWTAREDKTKPQPEIVRWSEKTAPIVLPRESAYPENSPYRSTLTGKIAVLAIIISGPGSLAISESEKNKVISEMQAGLRFWTDQAQAARVNLQFYLHYYYPHITAADSNYCSKNNYAACHDVFVNPALTTLGFGTGQAGKDAAAQYIKDYTRADGAYIGFFSKYRQSHFAYAYFHGGPLYMQYSNDGWGTDQIDRVFAHETGHVFNAPDEYTNDCSCYNYYGKGMCSARNENCQRCTSHQVSCIMDSNDLSLCEYTKKHLGWC